MMRAKHLVVVGASAGGIEALRTLVGGLPSDFPAPVCVVMHTAPHSPGVLADILRRAGVLNAVNASNGERLRPGHIYVAPPDCHLLVEPGILRVTKGPRENRFRPAVDPLFRSAAQVYGPATIGVLLTGSLDDGTAGLWAVKQLGGVAVVQDPADALYPEMPQNAIQSVNVDHVIPLTEIAPLLVELTSVPVAERPVAERGALAVAEQMDIEVRIAKEQNAVNAGVERVGEPSTWACPECHGVLLQLKEGGRIRFRCHTGHAYSVSSLIAAVSEAIEDSLWNTVRALEEGGLLLHRMAEHVKSSHNGLDAQQLVDRAEEARRQAEAIRKLATEREPLTAAAKG